MRRILVALFVIASFGATAPASAHAQDQEGVMQSLQDAGLGLLGGCDYAEYLRQIESLAGGWEFLQSMYDGIRDRRHGIPATDYISMLFRGASTQATKESAEAESQGLLYQLEQVCNSVVQADEINRMFQIVEGGNVNIGNAIEWLLGETGFDIGQPGSDQPHVVVDYANLMDQMSGDQGTPSDTLWTAVVQTLRSTLDATAEYGDALDRIHDQVRSLERDLLLLAEWDPESEQWTCPENYPDPAEVQLERDSETGNPICGPATPERSTQVLAHVELLKTELRALQMDSEARGLEVEAVRLMADNHNRKVSSFTRSSSFYGF